MQPLLAPKISPSQSLTSLSASQAALLIRKKQISPTELLEAYFERIEQLEPQLNAFATVNFAEARSQAQIAEARVMRGAAAMPLLGVPVTIKSCIDVKGLACEAGSNLRKGHVPSVDATVVVRLKQAGAIILGNTCTAEMLMSYDTESPLHGTTNNPWNISYSAGGSSGGEAAAIAAGMSAAGVGSDGGGSIRVPAHFCGICGLKPTPGRISAKGHFPEGVGPFAYLGVVGPMARTVSDLQILFNVLSGYDFADPASSPELSEEIDCGQIKHLRIGFYDNDGLTLAQPEMRQAVQSAAIALAQQGFSIEEFRPEGLEQACELWAEIFVDAGAMLLRPLFKEQFENIGGQLKEFFDVAARRPSLTGERLLTNLVERDRLRLRVLSQLEQYPILISPPCSITAFKHGEGGWRDDAPANYLRTMTFAQQYNLLGFPTAVVPVTHDASGLPIGVQVIGRPFKEDEVLGVADVLNRKFSCGHPQL